MAKKDWRKLLDSAIEALDKSHKKLNMAVKSIMEEKGFTTEQVELFGANFATGNETVISFNNECEMADLDISVAAAMSKEEIIRRLITREVSETTRELLNY